MFKIKCFFRNISQGSNKIGFIMISLINYFQFFITHLKWTVVFFLFLFYFFTKLRYNFLEILKQISQNCKTIFEQILAALPYLKPIMEITSIYGGSLLATSNVVQNNLPYFIVDLIDFYDMKMSDELNIGYFLTLNILVSRFKFPKSRFIRFHWLRSLFISLIFNIPHEWYDWEIKLTRIGLTDTDLEFWGIIIWVIAFIISFTAFLEALFGKYPKLWVVREAVEVALGRDGEDFIWWDEENKK